MNIFKTTFFLFLGAVQSSLLNAQLSIDSVGFRGIDPKTSKQCLVWCQQTVAAPKDSSDLNKMRQVLLNTRIFAKVNYSLETTENKTILWFDCDKIVTLLPIVNLGNVRGNPFCQLGVRELNFAHRLGAFKLYDIVMNSRHSFYHSVELPYVNKTKWGISWKLNWASTLEPIYFSDKEVLHEYNAKQAFAGVFYQFKPNNSVFSEVGYINQAYVNDNLNIYRKEKGFQLKLSHSIQHINYKSLYLDGWGVEAETKSTFGSLIPFFQQSIITGIYYKQVGRLGDFAMRTKLGLTSNKLGVYGPFTLDSYLNLRGAGTKIDRGTGQLVLNLEYRQTLLQHKKFCVQTLAFTDFGTWRKPNQRIADMFTKDAAMGFYGLGARLFFTQVYDLIIRVDYGVSMSDLNQRGLVLGLGQYF
jgi:hypothetical protein